MQMKSDAKRHFKCYSLNHTVLIYSILNLIYLCKKKKQKTKLSSLYSWLYIHIIYVHITHYYSVYRQVIAF